MENRRRVSVVVPVRDDPRLAACLEALRHQTYPPELVEVVVADNGSSPPVTETVDPSTYTRCVVAPDGGSYAARNAAVALSTGEVLAFTDADCLPAPTWLTEIVSALHSGADVVAGHVEVYARDDRRPHPVEAYELVHAFPQETYVRRGGGSVTANLATLRTTFDAVGPFRHELYSGADIEWGQRAGTLGMSTVYCRKAVVRHPARDSFGALNAKLRRVIMGRHERNVLDGAPEAAPWPPLRSLVPPVGALRRARDPRLVTQRARAGFVIGEFYHRYAAAWHHLRLAIRTRR